jgi:hypothetical protein
MKLSTLSILLVAFGLADARLGSENDERDFESVVAAGDDIRIGVLEEGEENDERDLQNTDGDLVRVMVGFKNDKGKKNAVAKSKKVFFEFSSQNVVTMTMSTADVAALQSDPTIA